MAKGFYELPTVLPVPTMPFYALRAGQPLNGLMAVSRVVCPQGRRPAAVFYPLGYPSPYGPVPENEDASGHSGGRVVGGPSSPISGASLSTGGAFFLGNF
jgi:hypothetical protein